MLLKVNEMEIKSENSIGQIENGSPAQILSDGSDLATLIFGSNFDCVKWCEKYCEINSEDEISGISEGFKLLSSACNAHTHAHTHTHAG